MFNVTADIMNTTMRQFMEKVVKHKNIIPMQAHNLTTAFFLGTNMSLMT